MLLIFPLERAFVSPDDNEIFDDSEDEHDPEDQQDASTTSGRKTKSRTKKDTAAADPTQDEQPVAVGDGAKPAKKGRKKAPDANSAPQTSDAPAPSKPSKGRKKTSGSSPQGVTPPESDLPGKKSPAKASKVATSTAKKRKAASAAKNNVDGDDSNPPRVASGDDSSTAAAPTKKARKTIKSKPTVESEDDSIAAPPAKKARKPKPVVGSEDDADSEDNGIAPKKSPPKPRPQRNARKSTQGHKSVAKTSAPGSGEPSRFVIPIGADVFTGQRDGTIEPAGDGTRAGESGAGGAHGVENSNAAGKNLKNGTVEASAPATGAGISPSAPFIPGLERGDSLTPLPTDISDFDADGTYLDVDVAPGKKLSVKTVQRKAPREINVEESEEDGAGDQPPQKKNKVDGGAHGTPRVEETPSGSGRKAAAAARRAILDQATAAGLSVHTRSTGSGDLPPSRGHAGNNGGRAAARAGKPRATKS